MGQNTMASRQIGLRAEIASAWPKSHIARVQAFIHVHGSKKWR